MTWTQHTFYISSYTYTSILEEMVTMVKINKKKKRKILRWNKDSVNKNFGRKLYITESVSSILYNTNVICLWQCVWDWVCADDLWLLLAPAGLRDVVEGMDYHGDEVCCCPPRWSVLGLVAEQELALADLSQYGSLWRNVEKLLTAVMRETSAPRMTQNSHRLRVQLQ